MSGSSFCSSASCGCTDPYLAFALPGAYTVVSLCIGSHDGVGASPLFCWAGASGRFTGIGRGVFACRWKKFAKPPRGLHARKGWKLLMSNGKSANNASCGCTSIAFRFLPRIRPRQEPEGDRCTPAGSVVCRFSIRHQQFPALPSVQPSRRLREFFPPASKDSPAYAGKTPTSTGPTKKWACAHPVVRPDTERNDSICPGQGKSKIRV